MSKNFVNCLCDLKKLSKKDKDQSTVLKKTDKKIQSAISEAALNVLHGNVPITKTRKTQLKKYKDDLRKLSTKSTRLKQKRKILNQKGGAILPLLLPPVLTFVAKALANKVFK